MEMPEVDLIELGSLQEQPEPFDMADLETVEWQEMHERKDGIDVQFGGELERWTALDAMLAGRSVRVRVTEVPVTMQVKLDLGAMAGLPYSQAAPSLTQVGVRLVDFEVEIPLSDVRGGKLTLDDLHEVIMRVSEPLDRAAVERAMRAAKMVKTKHDEQLDIENL